MNLQFGDNAPITSEGSKGVHLSLTTVQQPAKISLRDERAFRMGDHFTVIMRDPDAPGGTFFHALFINVNRKLMGGETVLDYLPPQKVNHRYIYEIYLQPRELPIPVATREDFNINHFVQRNRLTKVATITVKTLSNPSMIGMDDQLDDEIRPHDFVKHDGLTDQEEKYCRCVLHVQAGGRARNPYAVCTKTVGVNVRTCGDHYNWDAMPLPELLAYADLKKLQVPDRSSRQSIIDAIFRWKDGHK